jgi:iron(II)-dependent oxidoreductase
MSDGPTRALGDLLTSISSGGHSLGTVSLGSTEAEVVAALELCHRLFDHCEASDFQAETLHPFDVKPIEMDRFEITNAEFGEFVERTGRETIAERQGASWDGPTRRRGLSWREPALGVPASKHADWPVVHVSFADARDFCESVGRRLPDADEWEYQARGDARRIFPWGDDWDGLRLRWTKDSSMGLEPVGSHPRGATPDRIQDMAGSVWEWTTTAIEGERAIKGASWDDKNPAYFRAAAFATESPEFTSNSIGFRCVRDR